MAVVPSTHTFVDGISSTSELNAYVRDPINFALNRPIARLLQTSIQAIPSNAQTPINWDTEVPDSVDGHSGTNPSRYTAVYAGWYQVSGTVTFAANVTGIREIGILVNGAPFAGASASAQATAVVVGPAVTPQLAYLNVGDYVELYCYQNSGGSLNTAPVTTQQPSMTIVLVSN